MFLWNMICYEGGNEENSFCSAEMLAVRSEFMMY